MYGSFWEGYKKEKSMKERMLDLETGIWIETDSSETCSYDKFSFSSYIYHL